MRSESRGPAYRVETVRLVLRCWSPRDAPLLRASLDASAAHLAPFIPFMRDEPRTLEQTARWLRALRADFDLDRHFRYAVFDRAEEVLLGEAMLLDRAQSGDREVGFWIDERHCRKGYASEAAAALTRLAFELEGVDRVELHCSTNNVASAAVAAKLGYTHEATLGRRLTDRRGERGDIMVWVLFQKDFSETFGSGMAVRAYDVLDRRLI